jgi:polar amino acid transport system permease protein
MTKGKNKMMNTKKRGKNKYSTTIISSVLLILFFIYFLFFSNADWSLFKEQFLNFEKMEGRYYIFISPFFLVLKISFFSCFFASLIGLCFAVIRNYNFKILDMLIASYVVLFRSIPAMVLVVLIYFALPFVGLNLPSTNSVIMSLSLLFGAYTTEILRSGINSVDKLQIEASKSLGMNSLKTMRFIILPQAMRVVIPPLTTVLIDVLKTTSIAYVVGVPELIARARQMEGVIGSVTPLIFVSILYFLIILPVVILSSRLEKRSRKWSKA